MRRYVPSILGSIGDVLRNILKDANVVFTTLAMATMRYSDLRSGPRFDVAVVDEASVVLESMMWSPILVSRSLMILGDPQQLPPVVHSRIPGHAVTMFDRLASLYPDVYIMLDTQYRMCYELIR